MALQINFDNALVSKGEMEKTLKKLSPRVKELRKVVEKRDWDADEASLLLPDEEKFLQQCEEAAKMHEKAQSMIVVGIGGPGLGAKAVYNAVGKKGKKLLFVDTVDDDAVAPVLEHLAKNNDCTINIATQSGTTTESVANAMLLLGEIGHHQWKQRVVVTTNEGSKLHVLSKKLGLRTLLVPKKVGGRYSVFSSVGLFPLCFAGVSCKKLLQGAREMKEECLQEENNPAATMAVVSFLSLKAGKNIHDEFVFSKSLEDAGKWWRQLNAESLGKKEKQSITPTVSVGSVDLHSTFQLYRDGPKDKFFRIVRVKKNENSLRLPQESALAELVPHLQGKTLGELMDAIVDSVEEEMKEKKIPFAEICLQDKEEHSIGALLQLQMVETMLLAEMLGVNAFNQPGVEGYKQKMRKMLEVM